MPRWRNGRRARFRCECCEACRFESCSGHHNPLIIDRFSRGLLFLGCTKSVLHEKVYCKSQSKSESNSYPLEGCISGNDNGLSASKGGENLNEMPDVLSEDSSR